MLNREKHQRIMGSILRNIYMDISIAPLLGFKGGTAAYFFYGLPRFSVDLDFDLLVSSKENQQLVFEKIKTILKQHGQIKDSYIKHFTVFALLFYGDTDHNIKVEVNTRKLVSSINKQFELKEHLGISILVAKKEYLFASKLIVLTSRSKTAMRDIYDINYFAKNNWDINHDVILEVTGKTTKEYLSDCIAHVETVKDNEILHGLRELVSENEKNWVRNSLKRDAIFQLKNYQAALK